MSLLRTGTYVLGWDLSLQATVGKVAGAEARHVEPDAVDELLPDRPTGAGSSSRVSRRTGTSTTCAGPSGGPICCADPRFADAGAIRRNRTEVIAVLDEIIASQTLDVWADRFDREGVWWAPAQGPADVLADPQLAANDGFLQAQGRRHR